METLIIAVLAIVGAFVAGIFCHHYFATKAMAALHAASNAVAPPPAPPAA